MNDSIDEFISAGTEYVFALMEAREKGQRINKSVIESKLRLRQKLEQLLEKALKNNKGV